MNKVENKTENDKNSIESKENSGTWGMVEHTIFK